MATKVTMSSTHPDYCEFGEWFDRKINAFIASDNQATADAWQVAMQAKTDAEVAANATVTLIDSNTAILSKSVIVDEFNEIHNQWIAEYNVQFTFEEV